MIKGDNMSRALAHIERIEWIEPIKDKDNIVLAGVLGWQVIVKKDEFKVGDLCIYVECDSIMPERPEFEFLRSKNFRIKTMKMGGIVSQGICFPLDILKNTIIENKNTDLFEWINSDKNKIPYDVTNILGITQYEKTKDSDPEGAQKLITKHKYPKILMRMKWFRQLVYKQDHREGKGFPTFISKTDETRAQNIPHILQNKQPWIVSEKVDGQSATFVLVKRKKWYGKKYFEYIVCSRNLRLWNKDNSSYWKVSDSYEMKVNLNWIIGDHEWVAIQGECYGPGIQGNKYNLSEYRFAAFNLIYPDGRVNSLKAKQILSTLDIPFVPIIDTDYILPDTIQEVLDYARGKSVINKDTWREGLVFRSQDGVQSFKAVDPLFLIKYDE